MGRVVHMKTKGQLDKLSSLLPPCEYWESNSGHQAW